MFDNVGQKLQSVTKIVFYTNAILLSLCGLIAFVVLISEDEDLWLLGIAILLVCVAIISVEYLISLYLVGYGKVVENSEKDIGKAPITSKVMARKGYDANKSLDDDKQIDATFDQSFEEKIQQAGKFISSLPIEQQEEARMILKSHKDGQITAEEFEEEMGRFI